MNSAIIWLLIFLFSPVIILIICAVWSKIDYNRQVAGKKKVRGLKKDQVILDDKGVTNVETEMLRNEAKMKSAQNAMSMMNLK